MAFVDFAVKKGCTSGEPLPKGVCSLALSKALSRLTVSAPDALNGLKAHNYVRLCFDAATNTLGVRKSESAASASKIQRKENSGIAVIALPAALRALLLELEIKPGRFYFVDNPKTGFYTVDLTEVAK
jgi:hypothetical protein